MQEDFLSREDLVRQDKSITPTNLNNDQHSQKTITDEPDCINIFIPLEIHKRGGTAMVIMPKEYVQNSSKEKVIKNFDHKLIKAIARAYKWKTMLSETQNLSLADIARKENLSSTHISKVFNLNFLSPKIVERILNGTQPRTLKLQDIITNRQMPDLWQEQEEMWGF